MDYSFITDAVLRVVWWLVPALLLIAFFKSAWFKGWLGEALVRLTARLRLPSGVYQGFHNVTLPTADGTTQIDHVFVSPYGIFVVETKHMKGWIFGGEKQSRWTQKLFKQSFTFQNPLRQNYKHVKALEDVLDVPPEAIHSVVAFMGDSTFKTSMPANVVRGGRFISYIKSFAEPVLSESEVREVVNRIQSGRLTRSWKTDREHVRQLKERFKAKDGDA